ncbi:hypothetical protein VFPPC_17427 [Pochonia chlamydosporia 170]|uniref:Uncharacterized protein n=1 Tax=Pochonia chlamydosporia 170 TaxID=1380566 RepID=A0A219AT03_METCM|nr:hypothetical protein VFPPC_17427 [Pochonia chlamydosporia 170]OWT43424.1 hypothetical protein VFPPC_17427 [Pochonia chlamydosporia 170]
MRCAHLRSGPAALRRVSLGEVILLTGRAVDGFLEHGLRVNHFKLGLEVVDMVRCCATVGTTTGVGKLEVMVHDIVVTSTIAVLLDLLGIDINIATLGKVSWQILHGGCSAFSNALVVTVICLVGAGH